MCESFKICMNLFGASKITMQALLVAQYSASAQYQWSRHLVVFCLFSCLCWIYISILNNQIFIDFNSTCWKKHTGSSHSSRLSTSVGLRSCGNKPDLKDQRLFRLFSAVKHSGPGVTQGLRTGVNTFNCLFVQRQLFSWIQVGINTLGSKEALCLCLRRISSLQFLILVRGVLNKGDPHFWTKLQFSVCLTCVFEPFVSSPLQDIVLFFFK